MLLRTLQTLPRSASAAASCSRWAAPGTSQLNRALASAAGRVVIEKKPAGERRSRLPQKAALEMTDTAAERIRELLEARDEIAVRVGIKTRGCNGLSYTMSYANEKKKLEEEVEHANGARVYIEAKALMHVVGTTMDFVEDDLTSEFVFHNPNAEASCGCGESFTTNYKPTGPT